MIQTGKNALLRNPKTSGDHCKIQIRIRLQNLAEQGAEATSAAAPEPTKKPEKPITIEQVRAVMSAKSDEGKTAQVRTLLMKYDAGKLSGVKPEDYPDLLREVEAL